MQVHQPRFYQSHIEQIHQIAAIVGYHPIQCVFRGLVRKRGTQRDDPGIVRVAEGYKKKPGDVDLTWKLYTFLVSNL